MKWVAINPTDRGFSLFCEGDIPFDGTVEPPAAETLAAMGSASPTGIFLESTVQQIISGDEGAANTYERAKDVLYTLGKAKRISAARVVVPFKIWIKK